MRQGCARRDWPASPAAFLGDLTVTVTAPPAFARRGGWRGDVPRHRADGLSLAAAMARAAVAAATADSGSEQSIFAGVRRHHPSFQAHVLDKALLLAVTRRSPYPPTPRCGGSGR
jgi:hypothetical protein